MSAPAPMFRPTRAVTALSVIVALAGFITTLTFAVSGEAAPLSPAAATETSESEPATTTTEPATTSTEPGTTTTEAATTTTAESTTTSTTTTTEPATTTTTSIPGTPPSAPLSPRTVVEAPRSVGVRWSWPADNGSSALTGFVVRYRRVGTVNWSSNLPVSAMSLDRTVTQLQNGAVYEFQIAAVNSAGQGEWTAPVPATTWNVPTAPGSLTANPTSRAGELIARWWSPGRTGGTLVRTYVVQRAISGTTWWVTVNTTSGIEMHIRGLTPGGRYDVRVAAVNAVGQGPWSTIAIGVPVGPPSAPRTVVASARPGSALLTWQPPATTYGLPVTYLLERRVSGSSTWYGVAVDDVAQMTRSMLVRGLRPGVRYYFRLTAVTSAGRSGVSASPNAIPAPVGVRVTVTPSRTSVKPGDDITYTIRVTNTSAWTTGSILLTAVNPFLHQRLAYTEAGPNVSYAFPFFSSIQWALYGIKPGVTVTLSFKVRVGDSPTGVVSTVANVSVIDAMSRFSITAKVTALAGPKVPPSVPTNVRMFSGSDWAVIDWRAPTYYGSSHIDGYVVQRSTSPTGPWTTVARLGPGAQAWGDHPLTNVRRYYYRVVAYNDAGTGAFSTPLRVP